MSQLPARSTCTIIIFSRLCLSTTSPFYSILIAQKKCLHLLYSFIVLFCFVTLLLLLISILPNFPLFFSPFPFFSNTSPSPHPRFPRDFRLGPSSPHFFLLRPATNFPNRHHLPTSPPAPDPEFPHANTLSNGTSASSGASPNYPLFPPPHHGPANSFCRQRTHAASTVTFWRQSSLLAILSPQFCAMLPFPCFASLLRLA